MRLRNTDHQNAPRRKERKKAKYRMPAFVKVKEYKEIRLSEEIMKGLSNIKIMSEVVWVQDGSLAYLRLELA